MAYNNKPWFLSSMCVRVCWGLADTIWSWLGSAGWLQAAGRFTSAPGVCFWDQQPHKVCTCHQAMVEAQGAKPSLASSFKISSCFLMTNIPSAKTSGMAKPNISLVGKCALSTVVGGLEWLPGRRHGCCHGLDLECPSKLMYRRLGPQCRSIQKWGSWEAIGWGLWPHQWIESLMD